jgi:hypothetical protein
MKMLLLSVRPDDVDPGEIRKARFGNYHWQKLPLVFFLVTVNPYI